MQSTQQKNARGDVRLHNLRPSEIAITIVVFVLVGVGVTLLLLSVQGMQPPSIFTEDRVRMFGMVDNRAQRLAYNSGLVLLAVLSFAALYLGSSGAGLAASRLAQIISKASGHIKRCLGAFLVTAVAIVFFFNIQGTVWGGPEGRTLRTVFLLISVCLTCAALGVARRLQSRTFTLTIWVSVVAYVIFISVPGFIPPIFLSEPFLTPTEFHYSLTLAQGDRLASGFSLGNEINLTYGLIPSLALAVFERRFGLLDFGAHIRLVQVSQVAFLVTAVFAYRLWKPHNPLFILFGTLLVGPWLTSSHMAIFRPNLAGWRNFGFAIGVVFLLLIRRQPLRRAALILGCCAGFLILYNPETGLCLAFGYGLFLLSRLRGFTIASGTGLAIRALLGVILIFSLALGLYRLGLGEFPVIKASTFLGFMSLFRQGYGSLPMYFDPLALLIFGHCIYLVAFITNKWRQRGLDFDECVRLSIAATILVWFTYYVNRPHPWNLWTYQFLYVFLIANFLEPRFLQHLRRKGAKAIAEPRLIALTFILLPAIISNNYHNILSRKTWNIQASSTTTAISGIEVPKLLADILRDKANFVARQDSSSTLYFTRNSYSLALLTQHFIRVPVQDAFAETATDADFERLVDKINNTLPRIILFDVDYNKREIDLNPDLYFYARFFNRLKGRLLDHYQPSYITQGWQVWKLRSD
jgi:hypothetical protein